METKNFESVKHARAVAKKQMEFFNLMMHGPDKLKHLKGNLIDLAEHGEFDIIVQGCNCFETMGSGIAKEIKKRYPAAYDADVKYSSAGDYHKLGDYSVMLGKQFNIINAYTQYGFRTGGEDSDVFEYDSFKLILQKLAHTYPGGRFGFPYIGMGLAGGDTETILSMLEAFARTIDKAAAGGSVTLVEFA